MATNTTAVSSTPVEDGEDDLEDAQLIRREEEVGLGGAGYVSSHDMYNRYYRSVERHFNTVGEKKPSVLLAVSIGVEEFHDILTTSPFKDIKTRDVKKNFIPQLRDLHDEVQRRSHFFMNEWRADHAEHPLKKGTSVIKAPSSKNWRLPQFTEWLQKKTLPLDENRKDITFLRKTILEFKTAVAAAGAESQSSLDDSGDPWISKGWAGLTPWIRLIQIVDSEEMRGAFIMKDDPITRLQLDAIRSDSAHKTFWVLLQEKFNDETYRPSSYELDSSWGEWYKETRRLDWDILTTMDVTKLADGKAAKERYRKLNNLLGGVYKNWEASGNGEDMYAKDLELGIGQDLPEREMKGGDRIDFLHNQTPAIMYLWYVLLMNDLFQVSLTEIDPAFQAEGNSFPSVYDTDATSLGNSNSDTQDTQATAYRSENRMMRGLQTQLHMHNLRVNELKEERSSLHNKIGQLGNEKNHEVDRRDTQRKEKNDLTISIITLRRSDPDAAAEIKELVLVQEGIIEDIDANIIRIEGDIDEANKEYRELRQQIDRTIQEQEERTEENIDMPQDIDRTPTTSNQRRGARAKRARPPPASSRRVLNYEETKTEETKIDEEAATVDANMSRSIDGLVNTMSDGSSDGDLYA
jgi:hypothetical protein